jgi:hypothetical protein
MIFIFFAENRKNGNHGCPAAGLVLIRVAHLILWMKPGEKTGDTGIKN